MKKVPKRSKGVDASWMKCCRWCHWYDKGMCYCKDFAHSAGDSNGHWEWFNYACEEGKVEEILKESMQTEKLTRVFFDSIVKIAIKSGTRGYEKRLKEFKDSLHEIYDEFLNDMAEQIDSDLNDGLEHWGLDGENESSQAGVEIFNPEEFCCSHYM